MTNEDLSAPDSQMIASEMKDLILEARDKIKPVVQAMPESELRELIMTLEDAKEDKTIVVNRPEFYSVLERIGVTLEELRKIQDKHYEVDIAYELTRDLYEKQRVLDGYLEEHREDDQLLNQYYANAYRKAAMNRYRSLVYHLPYEAVEIRGNYRMMWLTTSVAAGLLFAMHPALALLMSYDYYLLLRGTAIMNQTCNMVVLDKTKRHVFLSKLNFLGYERKPVPKRISLKDISYIGEYENTFVTMDNYGLFPSLAQYLNKSGLKKDSGEEKDSEKSEDGTEENVESDESKNNFRYFYKFMANNETYLLPRDHKLHDSVCISNELLLAILNAKQHSVFDYDFTDVEAKNHEDYVKKQDDIKEILDFKGIEFNHEESQLQRKYSYFVSNREFSGRREDQKLKKVDDGTFIDNGYR